jgi:ribonuclease R
MHRLGDVVDVRLVEAVPIAGALRFELLSEGQVVPRGRKREASTRAAPRAKERTKESTRVNPGRSPREKPRKPKRKKSGKSKGGKSWKP